MIHTNALKKPLQSATFETGFKPGYLGRITALHGEYYAKAWGSGSGFEAMMARELCDFHDRYDENFDLLYTAHADGKLIGSIAIDGTQRERPGEARLRWYIIDEDYQGQGIGKKLIEVALNFCREKGFKNIFLWSVEGLPESLHLYKKVGFRIVERFVDARYTLPHTQIRMEMRLD